MRNFGSDWFLAKICFKRALEPIAMIVCYIIIGVLTIIPYSICGILCLILGYKKVAWLFKFLDRKIG